MSINYNARLNTHVAQDRFGVVLGIYNPAQHGSLDEFRRLMTEQYADA